MVARETVHRAGGWAHGREGARGAPRARLGRAGCRAALAALVALAPGTRLAAQDGGVEGTVLDEDGAPVYAASVVVGLTETDIIRGTETDRAGYFRITDLSPGRYVLRAFRLGFDEVSEEVVLRGDEATLRQVRFVLPRAVLTLEGFSVEAARSRERARFEEEAGSTVREITGAQ